MLDKNILNFIKKHQLFKKRKTILIGVSGGPDSMALLRFLWSIRDEWDLKLIVITVDHQLRGAESHADLEYVQQICAEWNIQCVAECVDVKAYQAEKQLSTQVAARKLRYTIFEKQMEKYQGDYLALGHHGDDQVETVLMALARSTNPSALSGIPAKRSFATGHIVRPLLAVTKAEINHYCSQHHIYPRIDPSNEDLEYTRNYFRSQVVPLMKRRNNNLHQTVQRLSESLQDDEHFLIHEAKQLFEQVVTCNKKARKAEIHLSEFKSQFPSLQRRVYQLTLDYLYDELPENLSYAHEEAFFSAVHHKQNMSIDFPHDLKLEKSYDLLLFYFKDDHEVTDNDVKLHHVPGEVQLLNGKIEATLIDMLDTHTQDKFTYICSYKDIRLPLHIRTRKPGDRMSWSGLKGSKKIKDIFIDEKIPRQKREKQLIVTDADDHILWLIGLKKGTPGKVSQRPPFLQLKFIES